MPVVRNVTVRRSRRLSKQPPQNGLDWERCEFMYPSLDGQDRGHEPPASIDTSLLAKTSHNFTDEVVSACPAVASLHAARDGVPSPCQTSAHGRRHKEGHVARPPNAFMIFRSHLWSRKKITKDTEKDHRHISRIAGMVWNELSDEQRLPYREVAAEAKLIHSKLHPDYKYSPVYRREKAPKRRMNRDADEDEERCKRVASLIMRGVEGDALEERMKAVGKEESLASSSSPAASKRLYRRASRSAKKTKAIHVKREAPSTPQVAATPVLSSTPMFPILALMSSSPIDAAPSTPPTSSTPSGSLPSFTSFPAHDEFVPTDDIPTLDLSIPVTASVDEREKSEEPQFPRAEESRPDHLMSDYVDPIFSRIGAQAIELGPDLSFSSNVADQQVLPFLNAFFQQGSAPAPEAYGSASSFDISQGSPVAFRNPFPDDSLSPSADDATLDMGLEGNLEYTMDESLMTPSELENLWINYHEG